MENLIEKIKQILEGIDKEESDDDKGWWETSTGAEFGKAKLEQVIQAVIENLESSTIKVKGK